VSCFSAANAKVQAHENNTLRKTLSEVPFPVKTASSKLDHVLCILNFRATCFFSELKKVHLHFAIAES